MNADFLGVAEGRGVGREKDCSAVNAVLVFNCSFRLRIQANFTVL